jgi:hypothetical protein
LFLEIVIFCLGGAAKLRWAEGRAAPRWAWQRAQNDGCAQRTGAHARLKPTSGYIFIRSGAKRRLEVPVTTSGGFMAKTTWRTNYDAALVFIAGLLAATVSYLRRFLFQKYMRIHCEVVLQNKT